MKRTIISLAVLAMLANGAMAQSEKQSFQEFRQRLHGDYDGFRSRILQHYADFLEGEWHPYEPLMAPSRYEEPKPPVAPVKQESDTPQKPARIPTPAPAAAIPAPPASPEQRDTDSGTRQRETPADREEIPLGGFTVAVPRIDFNILNAVNSWRDTPAQWKCLDQSRAREAAKALQEAGEKMGFNGYLTYLLASAYVKEKFPRANDGARMSATHYLMANMGYDVRLAMTRGGVPMMLIPFVQPVYGSVYLTIDGVNYTVFVPEGEDARDVASGEVYTCALPTGDHGRKSDLRIDRLDIPYSPHPFSVKGGGIEIHGELNGNIFPLIYRYPQMPTEHFALSALQPEVRESVVSQIRTQLAGKEGEEGVNALLRFFHEALPYATDEERHGFEKPYFMEETLFYDRCDCEDRAIMFTYLVWNALGLETHLNAYPLHESAAVRIDGKKNGHSYSYRGGEFFSTDPTYIGSSAGDVMPRYSTTAPKIDLEYRPK